MQINLSDNLVYGICAFISVIIFFRPKIGLYLIVIMVYMRLSNVLMMVHGFPSIAKVFIPAIALIVLIRWMIYGERPKNWERAALLLGGYGLLGISSFLYAEHTQQVRNALVVFLKDSLVFFIVVALLDDRKTLRGVVWSLLAAGIFMSSITALQFITGSFENQYWGFGQAHLSNIVSGLGKGGYRVEGPGLNPNDYGRFLLLIVPLSIDRLRNEKTTILRLLAAWGLGMSVLSIYFTYSRGAFVGLVGLLLFYFVGSKRRTSVIIVVILLMLLSILFLPPQYFDRLGGLSKLLPASEDYAAETDISLSGRISENIAAWRMFRDHPLLGVGLNNYKRTYLEYAVDIGMDTRAEERSPHSIYLEFLAELGILGTAWFFLLQWSAFRGLSQARQRFLAVNDINFAGISFAFMIALIGYLFAGLFLHLTSPRYFWLLYAIALTIPSVAKNEVQFSEI